METLTIKGEKYQVAEINESGVITEIPGTLIGAELHRGDMPAELRIYDAMNRNGQKPLLKLTCENGDKEAERFLRPWQFKRYEAGLAARLVPSDAKAVICYQPLDIHADIARIRAILEKKAKPQWVNEYRFILTEAATNKKVWFFPGIAHYIFIKKCTGIVTAKLNSPNFPGWDLSENKQIKFPFDNLWLTWPAQTGEEIIIYVSNQNIKIQADIEGLLAGYYWKDTRYEYDVSSNCIYKGLHRRLNALTADTNWYVNKYDYNGSNNCTQKRLQITSWDGRASGW